MVACFAVEFVGKCGDDSSEQVYRKRNVNRGFHVSLCHHYFSFDRPFPFELKGLGRCSAFSEHIARTPLHLLKTVRIHLGRCMSGDI
jgi:hypothetical protein